jgi:amino acid adenylation domain-containing protein/thioester reductase-like protein
MTLLAMLENICQVAAHKPAAIDIFEALSYKDLWTRARLLACDMRDHAVGQGSLVAVYAPRTVDVVAGIVGIMATGASYTIVEDNGARSENLNRLKAINPNLVLCHSRDTQTLQELGLPAIALKSTRPDDTSYDFPPVEDSQVAYVCFTSGSTGRPKGVEVTHANVAHYTASIAQLLKIDTPMQYAHVSTLAADLGNTSLFLSLWTGGCLHLVSADLRKDPTGLRDYLILNRIDFVKITPSHWNAIFSSGLGNPPQGATKVPGLRLRYLVLGGELLPTHLARRTLHSRQVQTLVNHYGPTETTVGVIARVLPSPEHADAIATDSVPIGQPFGNTTLKVRTADGSFHKTGVTGELYIGGPSVAAGYKGDPAATSKNFLPICSADGTEERYYKTGDIVSIDDEGTVRFQGRIDRQIKINGHRVELEHVESVLRTLTDVVDAAVFFAEIQEKSRIIAGLLGRTRLDAESLKQQLKDILPDYMIPNALLQFDAFPRNDNSKTDLKSLEAQIVSRLQANETPNATRSVSVPGGSSLAKELRALWDVYLKGQAFSDDDSFFRLGADSLDGIQLIGDLQSRGYRVTANSFLKEPSINGLLATIIDSRRDAPPAGKQSQYGERRSFSIAQDFFLRQPLACPDHYNQALLLECGTDVVADYLDKAISGLVASHPMLTATYKQDSHGWVSAPAETRPRALSVSVLPGMASSDTARKHIEDVSQGIQSSLSLSCGNLFKAHLFKSDDADRILLVAHHLSVDVISWRIIVNELIKRYIGYFDRAPLETARSSVTFWDWVDHINRHSDALIERADTWLGDLLPQDIAHSKDNSANTECLAQTLWMGFSEDETRLLTHDLTTQVNAPLHVTLMATFVHCLAVKTQSPTVVIDVESHGRLALDDSMDVSRVVGWHTSTFPISVDFSEKNLLTTIASCARMMRELPDLGVAHGVRERLRSVQSPQSPAGAICFNYIGEVAFNHDPRFPVVPSHHAIGRARGDANIRSQDLKFTARILAGRLIIDLSFSQAIGADPMRDVMRTLKDQLLGLLGREASSPNLVQEDGTRTGLITYAPHPLVSCARMQGRRPYKAVLLTGATGYLGIYILKELLMQSSADVYCIVRADDIDHAYARLQDAFGWYFPTEHLARFGSRIRLLCGDVSVDRLGLQPPDYESLASTVEAVYHCAANTKLFGPPEAFESHNIWSVKHCIDFVQHRQPKDLHYMSTLAVAGINPRNAAEVFDEDSADVGQEFQNFYESSKYAGEALVRRFQLQSGARGFIFRSGNISGDSNTGAFQRNPSDNRLVQVLIACAKLSAVPLDLNETLVLSPVDEVAKGIVAISLDKATQGGVFHVESPYEIPFSDLVDAMRGCGIILARSRHSTFLDLFEAVRHERDQDIVRARFWGARKSRNYQYNHARTHELLRRLGCDFKPLDGAWLCRFVDLLQQQGVLGSPPMPLNNRFDYSRSLDDAAASD